MKTCHLTAIFILLCQINLLAQFEKKVKAEVKSATVFLSGAQVNTEARTDIEAGNTKIIISNIPTNLNQDEIQVKGRGEAVIQGFNYKKNTSEIQKTKELVLLEDSLEHLKFEIDSITQMEEILNKEEQFIVANKEIRSQEKGVKAHDLEDIADVYRERLVALRAIIIKNKSKISKLDSKLGKLKIKLNNYLSSHGELIVHLNAATKAPVVLEISYITSYAQWRPSYEIKGKSLSEPLSIIYKAEIQQNTHIAWDNIKLTLSTGNPTLIIEKPIQNTWNIGFKNPQIFRNSYKEDEMVVDDMKDKVINSPAAAMSDIASMETEITSKQNILTEYEINTPYTISSDGTYQTLTIKSEKMNTFYSHFSAPKIDKEPMLLANILEWEKLNLLYGKANIFFEEVLAGSVAINPEQTTDTLQIPIKKDKKVVVTREKIKDFSGKKMLGLAVKQEFGYLITVKNTNKEAVNLTIEDQIPVSTDSQVEVEYLNESNAKVETSTGLLKWDLHLEPTESKKIIFKFAVKYPKDKIINGL